MITRGRGGPCHPQGARRRLYFPLKGSGSPGLLLVSVAAAASLYVLVTWFPHGTNCAALIGRGARSPARESLKVANPAEARV